MLVDTMQLAEGGIIENFVFPAGTVFPTSPDQGEVFYRTDNHSAFIYIDNEWVQFSADNSSSSGFIVPVGPLVDQPVEPSKISFNTTSNEQSIIDNHYYVGIGMYVPTDFTEGYTVDPSYWKNMGMRVNTGYDAAEQMIFNIGKVNKSGTIFKYVINRNLLAPASYYIPVKIAYTSSDLTDISETVSIYLDDELVSAYQYMKNNNNGEVSLFFNFTTTDTLYKLNQGSVLSVDFDIGANTITNFRMSFLAIKEINTNEQVSPLPILPTPI